MRMRKTKTRRVEKSGNAAGGESKGVTDEVDEVDDGEKNAYSRLVEP